MARIKRNLKPRAADPEDSVEPDYVVGGGDEDDTAPNGSSKKSTVDVEDEYFGTALKPTVLSTGQPKVPVAPAKGDKAAPKPAAPASKATKKGKGAGKGNPEAAAKVAALAAKRQIVSLGEPKKNLSKAAKKILESYHGKHAGKARDAIIKGHVIKARKKFGTSGVFHGSETNRLVVGIPCPLPFEFIIANDAFLLGIIYHLVGKHKSMKSGLLAEFFRWAYLAGGFGVLNECETKFSESWYRSIMRGADPGTGEEVCFYDSMPLNRCDSIEDWQKRLTFDIEGKESYKFDMEGTKEQPGPGRTFPIVFGVDSIMGKLTEKSQADIVKEGAAGRGYPVEALQIGRYLATMPNWLDRWPFAVVLVNHLKLNQNPDTGQEERNMSGGKRTLFQESFELELRKGPKINCTEFEGRFIDITCAESSFGADGRRIRTRVRWWEEPDDSNRFVQKTEWDWDWATTNLLHAILKGDDKGNNYVRYRKKLKDLDFHMDFTGTSATINATAWSKTLGVTKDDPLSWKDMGALIRETPAVVELLRNGLCIHRRPWLEGDYLEQLNALAGEIT